MANWRVLPIALACAGVVGLSACANPFNTRTAALPAFRDAGMSLQAANDIVATGTTTKAEALAALGPATVVKFDSGFEIWVYREKGSKPEVSPAELVILFTPEGIVSKKRIRPQYKNLDP